MTDIARGSVWDAMGFLDTFWLLLRFVVYLMKNMHSYLSKVFSEAPLGEHLFQVGAMQHDLPCKSVWLLCGTGFLLRGAFEDTIIYYYYLVFSVSAVINLFLFRSFKTVI